MISRRQLDLRQPRSISDLAKADASMGDDYAPVGYYQDTTIRGYMLDLATGFRINDLTVAGAQRFALEDKQRVEVLKGLAGLDAGVIAPGGLIDFVTKRPADVRRVTVGTDSHGSRYTAADLGAWLTPTFGLRFNGAWEKTHSYVEHANGRRNFYALAADWKIGERAVLRLDSDYQTSAQRSVSGYQLLGGTTVPAHASRTQMLGYEPWQLPVIIGSSNSSARLDVTLAEHWKLHTAVGHSRSVINDNVAYAYGCYYTVACASSGTPGQLLRARRQLRHLRLPQPRRHPRQRPGQGHAHRAGRHRPAAPHPEPGRGRLPAHREPATVRVRLRRQRQHRPAQPALLSRPRRTSRARPRGAWTAGSARCWRRTASTWASTGRCWPARASCAWTRAPSTMPASCSATRACTAPCPRRRCCGSRPTR